MIQPYNQFLGINTVNSPDDIKDSETPDARNNDISMPGAEKTRPGTSKVNTSALGDIVKAIIGIETEDEVYIRLAFTDDGEVNTF